MGSWWYCEICDSQVKTSDGSQLEVIDVDTSGGRLYEVRHRGRPVHIHEIPHP